MKSDFFVQKPKEMELTMTITMTLGQWNELVDQLNSKYPSWLFASHISSMVRQATKHFTEDTHEKED